MIRIPLATRVAFAVGTLLQAMVSATLSPTVAAQAPPPPACRTCDGKGSVPCDKHGKVMALETVPGVQWCSVAIECKACGGALRIDCKRCDDAASDGELAERRRLAQEWLQAMRQRVDKAPGHADFVYLTTTHFDLTFSIKPLTIDKVKFDTHALLHRYGERLEALRADFMKVLELTDADVPNRARVYMFDDVKDQGVIGPQETHMGSAYSVGLKLMGPEFVYSMYQDRRSLNDDEALHRNIVHNVTHLLLSDLTPMQFLGNRQHGWIDEGLPHWFEDRIGNKCSNFCFEEVLMQAGANFKGGRWRVPVRKLVDEGKAPSFASVALLNSDQLTFEQHAFTFAFVDFLITAHGGAKFRDLVRAAKNGKATRDALQEVYGLSIMRFDPVFADWVKATYPTQERKR